MPRSSSQLCEAVRNTCFHSCSLPSKENIAASKSKTFMGNFVWYLDSFQPQITKWISLIGKCNSAYFISTYLCADIQFYLICTFTCFPVSAITKCFENLESTFFSLQGILTFCYNSKHQDPNLDMVIPYIRETKSQSILFLKKKSPACNLSLTFPVKQRGKLCTTLHFRYDCYGEIRELHLDK